MGRRIKVYRPVWQRYKNIRYEYDLFKTLKTLWSWSDIFHSISSSISFITKSYWSKKKVDDKIDTLNRTEQVIVSILYEPFLFDVDGVHVGVSYLDTYGGIKETKHKISPDVIDIFSGIPTYYDTICIIGYVYGDKFVVEQGQVNTNSTSEKLTHQTLDELIYESVSEKDKDKIINKI